MTQRFRWALIGLCIAGFAGFLMLLSLGVEDAAISNGLWSAGAVVLLPVGLVSLAALTYDLIRGSRPRA